MKHIGLLLLPEQSLSDSQLRGLCGPIENAGLTPLLIHAPNPVPKIDLRMNGVRVLFEVGDPGRTQLRSALLLNRFKTARFFQEETVPEAIMTLRKREADFAVWGGDTPDLELQNVIRFILEELSNPMLSIEWIACKHQMSVDRLERLFGVWGRPGAGRFVRAARLQEAMRLLIETTIPISEIGGCVGYSVPSSFTRAIQSALGISPRAFRNKSRVETYSRVT